MNKLRIGKDFTVRWSINHKVDGKKEGYDLSGRDLLLRLQSPYRTDDILDFSTEGNTVVWPFRGKDQSSLGTYGLVLVENQGKDGMLTVDKVRAFQLVAHTEDEALDKDSVISVETVFLESEVTLTPSVVEVGRIEVDSELDADSENPVANRAIVEALAGKQETVSDLATIRANAAKGATALQTEQYKGTVTGVKINGSTKSPSSGIVDLGTVITAHQDISGKQDKIADLDAIRKGAAKGAAYEPYVTDFTVEQVRELFLGRGEEITVNVALLEDAIRAGRTIKVPYGGEASGYAIASASKNGDIYMSLETNGQDHLSFIILDSKISADYAWLQPSRPLEMTENGAYLDDNLSISGDFSTNDIALNGIKARDENGELFSGEEGQVLMSDGQGRVKWENINTQTGGVVVDSDLSETSTNPVQNAVITQNLTGMAQVLQWLSDGLAQKMNLDVNSQTESTISAMQPDNVYIIANTSAGDVKVNSIAAPVASKLMGRYTVMFTGATSLTIPSEVLWADGKVPTIDPAMHYELSIIGARFGSTVVYKAILTGFKSV